MKKGNPFTSTTFRSIWTKHFLGDKTTSSFNFVKNISFYQSKISGLYINAGKNLTKGLNVELSGVWSEEEKGKTFLIYDVLDFKSTEQPVQNGMGHYAVKQYPGYLIDLTPFQSLDDFMSKTFKKSSRYKLRKYKKRLEESFNISFKAHCGDISKDEYDHIFSSFRNLLEKRFADKQISNNNLDKDEWDFYKEVAYQMILEERAALLVLYNNETPISVTLCYLSENRIFDAITVFDIDYAKFHLGSIKIMYIVDWSIRKKYSVLDFSKGHFDYKTRWANQQYDFYYHIWYDKKSIKAKILSYSLKLFFTLKQFLREKNINETLHKFTYRLKHKEDEEKAQFRFEENGPEQSDSTLEELNLNSNGNEIFKRVCYEFLYLFPENQSNIKIYRVPNDSSLYLIKGKEKESFVRVNHQ